MVMSDPEISEKVEDGDALRTPSVAFLPDSRMAIFSIVSEHGTRPMTLEDRHAAIQSYRLNDTVPVSILLFFRNQDHS